MRIPAPLLIFVVGVITAVCLGAPVETATPLVGPYSLGAPVNVGSLTVWPDYTKEPLAIGEFLTLQEAEKAGLVKIEAIGGGAGEGQQRDGPARNGPALNGQQRLGSSDRAEVGRLVIVNGGKLPILVCAGTVAVGGKQDRQIGKDFVIAAGKRVMVDRFCVEQKAAETEHKTSGSNTDGIAKNARGYRANRTIVDGKKKIAVTRDWTRK